MANEMTDTSKDSVQTKVVKERNNQQEGLASGLGPLGYIKKGPAANHFGGNPTSGGGINRPTKGMP
jgi:hypothetical protein